MCIVWFVYIICIYLGLPYNQLNIRYIYVKKRKKKSIIHIFLYSEKFFGKLIKQYYFKYELLVLNGESLVLQFSIIFFIIGKKVAYLSNYYFIKNIWSLVFVNLTVQKLLQIKFY